MRTQPGATPVGAAPDQEQKSQAPMGLFIVTGALIRMIMTDMIVTWISSGGSG